MRKLTEKFAKFERKFSHFFTFVTDTLRTLETLINSANTHVIDHSIHHQNHFFKKLNMKNAA